MSFTQGVLLKVSTPLLGMSMIGAILALVIAGLLLVRRLIPQHRLKLHHDVAGPIFGTVGVIYAVLLAFVFVVVWEDFERADMNVEKEANCLLDIYRDAEAFPPDLKEKVRSLAKEYASVASTDEWESIAMGKTSPNLTAVLDKFWTLYAGYSPRLENEKIFYAESLRNLNALGELRSTRLVDSKTGVHPLLWFVLVSGGVITIAFCFFFGAENLNSQIVMTALLTLLISLIIFTILLFDFPFTGGVRISAKAFQELLLHQH
ncbi:MAG: DUF4239 domain-containing protein [Candidatus Omnitrophota bacterium]